MTVKRITAMIVGLGRYGTPHSLISRGALENSVLVCGLSGNCFARHERRGQCFNQSSIDASQRFTSAVVAQDSSAASYICFAVAI